MIDLSLQALVLHIKRTMKKAGLNLTVQDSPTFDVITEYNKSSRLTNFKPSDLFEYNQGMNLLLYKRQALTLSETSNNVPGLMRMNRAVDTTSGHVKPFTHGAFTVEFKFITSLRDAVEIFEMMYMHHIRQQSELKMKVEIDDTNEENFELSHTLKCSDFAGLYYLDYSSYGNLLILDFAIQVNGLFLLPTSTIYPKILRSYIQFYDHSKTGNDEPIVVFEKDVERNTSGEVISSKVLVY